ncbi:LytTR family DNA-binding domain-containing protein [Emticicia sp. BO119]|uniref:LytR/AlgR family response regulator transcription factor n=1 Tax=Emticicia sp. BO119 TaxID=2757768 RepID=UPI0015F07D04|nr:LytTR family DNA-binding domain-containing protein [Emticicia sp. BO119]MBA4851039.1 response regulator transcription factor [Emticicia sp. BO119]
MQKFNCIIVEDEPLAAEILQDYVMQVPFLQLKGVCTNAILATEALRNNSIDLIFLDINLPKLKGLDFIRTLHHPPRIILTTAYHEYALQGYEHNVLDYLLKPIEFSRFLKAVNKLTTVPVVAAQVLTEDRKYHFFNVSKKMVKVFFDEILYIESQREYVKIVTKAQTILTKLPLGEIEELLKTESFLRVHRSFIIAKDKIDAFSATDIDINGKQIPIGRGYKDEVWVVLGN